MPDYNINNAKNDIQNLQDQNSYDFQEIKRLDRLINDYGERVTQAINFNNQINKKIQSDYENIKKIIIDENVSTTLDKKIDDNYNSINNLIDEMQSSNNNNFLEINNKFTDVDSQLDKKANQVDLELERSRINQLARLSEGSTTGDAELIDGRIGIDGITYSNIGGAIRSQVTNLKNGKLNNKTIGLNLLNNNIIGNSYNVKGTFTQPEVIFDLITKICALDIKKVRLKFKFKNNREVVNQQLYLNLTKKGWWTNDIILDCFFEHMNEIGKEYVVDVTKDVDYSNAGLTNLDILDNFKIGFWQAVEHTFDFDIYDIELFINDIKIWDYIYSSDNTKCTNTSKEITYLVDRTQLDNLVDRTQLDNVIDEINKLKSVIGNISKSDLTKVVCWGDSITEGGSPGLPYPSVLKTLLGDKVVVTNRGSSGQCSGNIAFRQGGKQIYVNSDFTIPSDNTQYVYFKLRDEDYQNMRTDSPMECIINGVKGEIIITYTDSVYGVKFKRETTGDSVNVNVGVEIKSTQDIHSDDLSIIWVGRNDIAFSGTTVVTGTVENVQKMINHLSPIVKRFLIISVTTATSEGKTGNYVGQYNNVLEINKQLKNHYPDNFVDMRSYLIHNCLSDAGLTPTSADLEAIENDTIPPQLMHDDIHPNDITKQYEARYIYNILNEKGWIL